MRKSWGERMAELIVPGSGLLVALMFPIDKYDDCEGPPFALQPEDYHAVLGDYFELVDSFVPNESHNGREGREKLSVWRRRKVD